MIVLIGCEFSGVSRRAWQAYGHTCYSCDLLPAEDGEEKYHLRGDVRQYLDLPWDLAIFHPPCTHLAVSGARWFEWKRDEQELALEFVRTLLECPIPKIALENPVGIISTRIRPPDQIIQPYQFGHYMTKATCLWLKNLKPLVSTDFVSTKMPISYMVPKTADRWKVRSETAPGIAEAMAIQWGLENWEPALEGLV